jgi:hypothetical protein
MVVRWEREPQGLEGWEGMPVETAEGVVRVRLEQGEEGQGEIRDITPIAAVVEEAEVPEVEQVVRDNLYHKT